MILLEKYEEVRNRTVELCKPLTKEDYVPQAVEYASPPKWHLAHTTWFFEEMVLKRHVSDYKECNAQYSYLFNSYYNSVGDRTLRSHRGNITRPGVDEVYEYRKYVDSKMQQLLSQNILDDIRDLVILGLNHEQQHQELLITDLKFSLGHNPVFPARDCLEW